MTPRDSRRQNGMSGGFGLSKQNPPPSAIACSNCKSSAESRKPACTPRAPGMSPLYSLPFKILTNSPMHRPTETPKHRNTVFHAHRFPRSPFHHGHQFFQGVPRGGFGGGGVRHAGHGHFQRTLAGIAQPLQHGRQPGAVAERH